MDAKKILSILLLIGCTVVPIIASVAYERHRSRDFTAEILARAPEKGNFSPRHLKLEVPAGEEAKLRIRNVDTVMHGFAIPDLEVDAGEIKAGHSVIVSFTPERSGTHEFYCTVWCSEFHLQMRGILEVVIR
ncbi:MAG: cupredoxin domain-containing protein [Planctomycetota bacterium]|jgi:cytochrome c oxidase subunit 2